MLISFSWKTKCLILLLIIIALSITGCFGTQQTTVKINDLTLLISVSPDPAKLGDNTIKIKLLDNAGKIIKDAMVNLTYTMPAMGSMSSMESKSETTFKNGFYQGLISLSMGGTWDLRVEIHVPDKPHMTANFKLTTGTKGISYVSSSTSTKDDIDLSKETNVVTLTKDEQDIIGVETTIVDYKSLIKQIRSVGIVAYDPDLYVAQQEFVGALSLKDPDLISISKKRLMILGMSRGEIAYLQRARKPQSNLLLPEGRVWVYANFYDSDSEWLNEGQYAIVKSSTGSYSGRVVSIEPILKDMTRTLKARIAVDNPNLQLKPQMYVDVYLEAHLGQKFLVVPSEAVLDTGIRKLVYIDKGNGVYVGREIKTGPEASGFYPVLEGISKGDKVVSKANFLIDSQSKLTGGASSLYGSSAKELHQH